MNDVDEVYIALKYGLLSTSRDYTYSELHKLYPEKVISNTFVEYQKIHNIESRMKQSNIKERITDFNKILIEELIKYERRN